MAGGTLASMHLGEHVVIGGLFVQIIFFGFFVVVAISFDIAMHKNPTAQALLPQIPWHKHLNALYVASILIMIRSIFRIIEYIQGNAGYLLRHEYYIYIFDALLMLTVMLTFNILHPSEVKALLSGGKVSRGFKVYSLDDSEYFEMRQDRGVENGEEAGAVSYVQREK